MWFILIFCFSDLQCKTANQLIANILAVRWRALITRYLQTLYFRGLNYYHINVMDQYVDNPLVKNKTLWSHLSISLSRDQRITQDVDLFCTQLSEVVPKLIIWPFIVAYYTYQTYVK